MLEMTAAQTNDLATILQKASDDLKANAGAPSPIIQQILQQLLAAILPMIQPILTNLINTFIQSILGGLIPTPVVNPPVPVVTPPSFG